MGQFTRLNLSKLFFSCDTFEFKFFNKIVCQENSCISLYSVTLNISYKYKMLKCKYSVFGNNSLSNLNRPKYKTIVSLVIKLI